MALDRRQLLRGSLAAGAAAALPLGASAASAQTVGKAAAGGRELQADPFHLALLDANNNVIETHSTANITWGSDGKQGTFGAPTSVFSTGTGANAWAPLECKFRKLNSGEFAFMVCGGTSDNGRVTIHRNSDGAPLGWDSGLKMFPHSLEYLPTADAVIVVGTRLMDQDDPPPSGGRAGGCYQLYTAPHGSPDTFRKIPNGQHSFRQAHGVVWDTNLKLLWIYGGNKIVGYKVNGTGLNTSLQEVARLSDADFENGHDLQPDPIEPQFLWATGTNFQIKIDKSGGKPRKVWTYPAKHVKSFSRHRTGRGVWTASPPTNDYGSDQVNLLWPTQTVKAPKRSGQQEKWIYKARLTDI